MIEPFNDEQDAFTGSNGIGIIIYIIFVIIVCWTLNMAWQKNESPKQNPNIPQLTPKKVSCGFFII